MNPIYSIHLRIRRAEEHLDSLNRETEAFLRGNPNTIWREDQPDGSVHWKIRVFEQPPIRLSLLVADAIHNMRSALDHIMWQLVIKHKPGRPSPRTQFPICTSEESWSNVKKAIRYMPEHVISCLEAIQPYIREQHGMEPEGHFLRVLHKMWNREKHRELTDLGFIISRADFGSRSDYSFTIREKAIFEDEAIIATATPIAPGPHPSLDASFSIDIGLDEPTEGPFPIRQGLAEAHRGIRDVMLPAFDSLLI